MEIILKILAKLKPADPFATLSLSLITRRLYGLISKKDQSSQEVGTIALVSKMLALQTCKTCSLAYLVSASGTSPKLPHLKIN
jgi:hypothetical protein